MKLSKDNRDGAQRKGSGVGLAVAFGLLWAAAIGVTWYFYRENDSEGGLAGFFGRFHIIVVHMPVGLLFIIPLMEITGWSRWGKAARAAVPFVLWLAVITAAMASFLGFLMMNADGVAGRWMTLHMWTGLGVGVFAVLALVFKLANVGPLYALTLIAAIGLTGAAGHYGGAMVHSPEYLTEYAPERLKPILMLGLSKESSDGPSSPLAAVAEAIAVVTGKAPEENKSAVATTVKDANGETKVKISEGDHSAPTGDKVVPIPNQLVFTSFVQPILSGKCTKCHSEEKIKGKLRLDTHEMIIAGAEGTDYPTVVPGDAESSELIARVLMPEDDELFMPPEGKNKLSEAEVAVLKWWIAGGAKAEGTVSDLKADEGMLEVLAAVSEALVSNKDAEIIVEGDEKPVGIWPTLSAEEQKQRLDAAKLAAKEGGFSILPVSAEDDRLRVSAVNASASFGDEQLASLAPVAERVVWLDIGRTQVSDQGMASIGEMHNLERLHLEQTKVTDAGTKYLAELKNLEYLNLYGTEVSAAIFEPLAELRNLRKLFLWETKVDQTAAREFQRQMSLEVNIGWEVAGNELVDDSGEEVEAPAATTEPVPEKEEANPTPASEPKPANATEKPKPKAEEPKPAVAKPVPAPEAKAIDAPKPSPNPAKPAAEAKPDVPKPVPTNPEVKPVPTPKVDADTAPKPNAK